MLKEYVKSNQVLYETALKTLKLTDFFTKGVMKNGMFKIQQIRNEQGKSSRYVKLKVLKGTEKEKRCFVIATGPSLTIEDLCKMRNEITFGMNSLIKLFPLVGWETTYYGIQDLNTYHKLSNEIGDLRHSVIFYSLDGQATRKEAKTLKIKNNERAIEYPLYYGNHLYNSKKWNTSFSSDAASIVYDGYTIAYSLLQIAVYMGFREIYLIGADCNYNQDKKNVVDIGVRNCNTHILGDRMIYAYNIAKKYADLHGVKIYNATRGGMLEVFPRVNLDDILR